MLAWLPVAVSAQQTKKPFLCIEKVDGSVEKVPITDNYPTLYTSSDVDDSTGEMFCLLMIVIGPNTWVDNIKIPYSKVKRLYTKFEIFDDIAGVEKETDETTTVYSVSGLQVGHAERLSEMPKGVYLIKKGTITQKLQVR